MQTPTPAAAADLQAAVKKALHSASFAKFMTGAMALALAETREATADAVQLPAPAGPFSFKFSNHNNTTLFASNTEGYTNAFNLQRQAVPTDPENLGIWFGSEERKDDLGRRWTHWLPDHVVDDFGTLVPVTGGAA